ncbi:MAG: glycine cleavage system protein H [Desulfopila sp.]|jgi:glycine cleavage system H lipoate-binding protein|nr:glycine cleavage system protein H [Desulfopila sp.]
MLFTHQRNIVKGFQTSEDKCIWSKVGMVHSGLCDNVYDCRTCPYDWTMQKSVNTESKKLRSGWADNVKDIYDWTSIPCRHVLTGRVQAHKVCVNNYECNHCAYDQMLDDEDMDFRDERTTSLKSSGYLLAEEYYYHKGHTWARFEHGGRVKIGFDDFMVKLFGSPSDITLPALGAKLKKDHIGFTFSRSGNKATVCSPITGTVLAINNNVKEHPEIVHDDPYNEGWLCIVEPKMPKLNLKGLYYGKDSLEWTDKESQRLLQLIGPDYQNMAAAGGEPVDDIYASFPDIGWDRLVKTFLGSTKK